MPREKQLQETEKTGSTPLPNVSSEEDGVVQEHVTEEGAI